MKKFDKKDNTKLKEKTKKQEEEKTKFEILIKKSKGLKVRPDEEVDLGEPVGREYW